MTCDDCKHLILGCGRALWRNRNHSIEFLENHGVVLKFVKCKVCGEPATLTEDKLFWQCRKKTILRERTKTFMLQCNFKRSVRTVTTMDYVVLEPEWCCKWPFIWMTTQPVLEHHELESSSSNGFEWRGFYSEVLEFWCFNKSASKLGGPGVIVEIEEAVFGDPSDEEWVYGGYERKSDRIFFEKVSKKSSTTLLDILRRVIEPGTIVMSDCWTTYDLLAIEEYQSFRTSHSVEFVDPDADSYTERINNYRKSTDRRYVRNFHTSDYMAETLFCSIIRTTKKQLHEFFTTMADVLSVGTRNHARPRRAVSR